MSTPTPPTDSPFLIPPPEHPAPPVTVAAMDQQTLLSAVSFQLSDRIRVTEYDQDRVVVKYQPGRAYLNVTKLQWRALQTFADRPLMVPPVLFQLISDRRCPPLREFYELVVKAFECGLLQSAGHPPPPDEPAADWKGRVSAAHVRLLVVVAGAATLAATLLAPFRLPSDIFDLLAGWLLACLATSAGYALAACVIRDAEAEVYAPRFRWRTPFPHFRADLDDAAMGGRQTRFNAGLARLAPLLVCSGLVPWFAPGVSFLLSCALIWHLSPFWWSPGLTLLHARHGAPTQDAFRHFRFEPNRAIWFALRTRIRHTDTHFMRIHALHTVAWLALVLLAGSLPLGGHAAMVLHSWVEGGGLQFTALVVLALLGLMVAGALGTALFLAGRTALRHLREFRRQRLRPRQAPGSPEAYAETLAECLLFRGFSAGDRLGIVEALHPKEYPARATVIREGDPGDELYVVYSGRVEVLRDTAAGRRERVAVLGPGDVFGEMALLQTGRRTRSVHTLGKTVLLTLRREDFQRLVLSRLTRESVMDIVQKVAFLHRVPLSATWSPQAMVAFARRSVLQAFSEGAVLIRQDDDNQYFFLLYEGTLTVSKGDEEVARLHPGDFFGEISALQNSVATATIVARTPVRCLVLPKREFLQFLVNDFLIGLQFEEISSRRLGQPIFPMKGGSFDVLR